MIQNLTHRIALLLVVVAACTSQVATTPAPACTDTEPGVGDQAAQVFCRTEDSCTPCGEQDGTEKHRVGVCCFGHCGPCCALEDDAGTTCTP